MDLRGSCLIFFVLFSAFPDSDGQENITLDASPLITASSNFNGSVTPSISNSAVMQSNASTMSFLPSMSASPVSTSSNPSSTVSPSPTHTTQPTKPPVKPAKKGRSFDAASFFGGIILGVVLAIAVVVGYTWWQKKRKSYHSL